MRQTLKITTYILLFSLASISAKAQTLSLQECQKMALEHNKDIAKAKTQEEQLGYDVNTYKSNFFPRINLFAADIYSWGSGEFTINGGHLPIYTYSEAAGTYIPSVQVNADGSYTLTQYADFPDQTIKYKAKNTIYGGFTLTQPLYMGGKITTAYNMSKIGKEMAGLNIALTEDEIVVKTGEAYVLAVKAKELIQVANKYKDLLLELQKNVESAFKHGMKTRNDMMKVQVKLNEAELNITKAENGYRLAKMNLCHYIGKPLTSDIEVQDNANTDLTTHAVGNKNIDITKRTEYEILNKKVELAGQQVKLTRSEYMPNVAFMAEYSYLNGIEVNGSKLFKSACPSLAVTLKVPILNFGESTNKIRSAKAKQQIARLEQEDLNEQMMLEQQQALNNVEEAAKEVELTKSALSQAEENIKLSKQQYEVGFESLSDYLESQAMWQSAYANKVDAACQYNLAWLKYQKSKGEINK